MKAPQSHRSLFRLVPVLATALSLTFSAPLMADSASSKASSAVNLGSWIPPKNGGEFVEVNLRDNLLGMAAKLAAKDQPEVAELLNGIHNIRVHVIGLDDSNRAANTDHVRSLRTTLDTAGWEKVVSVIESDQEVAVHLKTLGNEAVQGLVVTVLENKKQAVVVHISGDIRPEKLATLGEKFGIEPLKNLPLPAAKKGATNSTKTP